MNLRRAPLSPRLALGCPQLGNLYRARGEEEATVILFALFLARIAGGESTAEGR